LAITLISWNISQEKIKVRLNSGNATYHAAQNLISLFPIYKCEHSNILYGYKTWSLTLKKVRVLRVFENGIVWGIFRQQTEETGG
jgi:hypothetical protein